MAYVQAGIAIYGAYKQHQAGEQAKEDSEANAAAIAAESAEAARRLKKQQELTLSETKARASASGIQAGGSVDVYLSEMRKKFDLEQDWIAKSGASAVDIERRKGDYAKEMATTSAWGTIAQGVSSLY